MTNCNRLLYSKWLCKHPVVFIPKYRRKVLHGIFAAIWARCSDSSGPARWSGHKHDLLVPSPSSPMSCGQGGSPDRIIRESGVGKKCVSKCVTSLVEKDRQRPAST